MKRKQFKSLKILLPVLFSAFVLVSCDKDDDGSKLRFVDKNLEEVGDSGFTGSIRLSENSDQSFNIRVIMDTTVNGETHLVELVNGTTDEPGEVALNLKEIEGTGGKVTVDNNNIKKIKIGSDSVDVNYNSFLEKSTFIRVIYSEDYPDSVIAVGRFK